MKTVLVGINSKYIHTCLAIWYLKANIECGGSCPPADGFAKEDNYVLSHKIIAREFTINDQKDNILNEIYKEKPEILAFSCYIWNFEMVCLLSMEIKKLLPGCKIILGGPEVSYNADEVLEENAAVDFVLCGEGEEVFSELHWDIINNSSGYKALKGIAFRENGTVVYNEGFNLVSHLDKIIPPYTPELLEAVQGRILYYESSRGCPFSCSYCISSTFNGVRYFPLDRVKQDLAVLLLYKPKLIKFVDRTFNCNKQRARAIIEHIISLDCDTVFHFEAAADLFDDEMLKILSNAQKGRIQFEIGLQTTNSNTLAEIQRVTDICRLKANVGKILGFGNMHIHLDLIAGLPYEDLESFKISFNEVYEMRPHQLQLGFLKMLKGSKIRNEAQKHGYTYKRYSPYEILGNSYISFEDILLLKDVEEVLERYFNSNRFIKSLEFIEKRLFENPFELYYKLSLFCRGNKYLDRPVSYRENILILYSFIKEAVTDIKILEKFRWHMVFDFLSSDSSCAIPDCLKDPGDIVPLSTIHQLLQDEDFIKENLPAFAGDQARNILKKVFFIHIPDAEAAQRTVLFDYTQKDSISGKFRSVFLE